MDAAQRPYFNRSLPLLPEYPLGMKFRSDGFNTIDALKRLPRTLRDCIHHFEDLMGFWSDVNSASLSCRTAEPIGDTMKLRTPTPGDAARVRHVLTDIQYTLVMVKFSSDALDGRLFELCRISLILYSLTILSERPTTTAVGHQLLSEFHRALVPLIDLPDDIQGTTSMSWQQGFPVGFYLWAIHLAAGVTNNASCDGNGWLASLFLKLATSESRKIKNWHSLKTCLSHYLWVPEIHNATSQRFWDSVARTWPK